MGKKTLFSRTWFLGFTGWEVTVFVAFYVVLIASYSWTLAINAVDWSDHSFEYNINFWYKRNTIDYALKFLFSIPIWILVFRLLRNQPLWIRLLPHLPYFFVFTFLGRWVHYLVLDAVGFPHLEGSGRVWDLYIPGLFYVLQFGILHAYEYVLKSRQQQAEQAELREAALKSELSAIRAQLNPHFLYNVFNTISASVPKESEQTRELIAQLSDMFRYQMQASRQERVKLREEVEFIQHYLQLEKARFGKRLVWEVDIPEELLDHAVPPMLLQPLVENSVRHGIAPLVEGGSIHLAVKEENARLAFSLADTGVGVKDKKKLFGNGIGLQNTRIRLERGFRSTLDISDNHPRGLLIRFSI